MSNDSTRHHTGDQMTTDTTSPQRPTDEDLNDLAEVFNSDPVPAMRRALELWGQSAPVAQPEPEGLTDEELWQIWNNTDAAIPVILRAAIAADRARYGHPTVAPVTQPDRQPTMEAGDLDDQGRCWWGDAGDEQFVPSWRLCKMPEDSHFTHWRPHWAIPLPTTTQEARP
jgi:hypothetical protein